MQAPEHDGCRDRKLPVRLAPLAGEARLRFVQLLDDAAAGFEVVAFCSVRERRRVERVTRRAPSASSSAASLRLTVVSGIPNFRPAADRLPVSATAVNRRMAPSRSMSVSRKAE